MKTLRTLIIVAVVFGFVASAQAIKVHQRLFLMTNTIEAAQSLGLVETNLNELVTVSDGTVAIDTDGVMYVNHTGVWQRVSGQGGTITTVTGNNGISAVEVAGTVTLDVDPGNGIIIDGSQNVAVGDGDGLVVNANDVEVGQGDGITVNADDVAVDSTVVRTFGDQDISGNKTFSDILVTNLTAINENVLNITISNMAVVATNLSVEGVIDMNGNQITNMAPGADGMDAVNYTQLTNATQSGNADLIAATNQLSNDLIVYVDGATNTVLNTANNYTVNYVDGATNQTLIDARNYTETYTDGATNALMIEAEDLFINAAGDDMTGVLGMGGNQITNLAPGTDGLDAVNYNQLTNAIEQDAITEVTGGNGLTATQVGSSVDVDVNAGDGIQIVADNVAVDATVVRTSGNQTITGVKTFDEIKVTDLYAENEHVVNITISNMAVIATNLSVEGIIDMNGNKITNMAAGTDGMDAVNYTQLTNATQSGNADLIAATNQLSNDLTVYIDGATNTVLNSANNYTVNYVDGATNQTLIDARNYTETYTDSATNALMIEAEDLFVNEAGDNMTGILGMGGNRITNVADAVNAQDAITKAQLDAATNNLAGDVTLQKAYDNGSEIFTAGNDVTISGSQGLTVSADNGVYISGNNGLYVTEDVEVDGLTAMDGGATLEGGALQVNGNQNIQMNNDGGNTGQINMDGNTGNESIRLNASGKMVIYSGGSLALEFE